jgi:hypothetical protein
LDSYLDLPGITRKKKKGAMGMIAEWNSMSRKGTRFFPFCFFVGENCLLGPGHDEGIFGSRGIDYLIFPPGKRWGRKMSFLLTAPGWKEYIMSNAEEGKRAAEIDISQNPGKSAYPSSAFGHP